MKTVLSSSRFYFWPIIAANIVAMGMILNVEFVHALIFSFAISCLASFGYIINDLLDRKIDLVNAAGHFELSDKATIGLGVLAAGTFLVAGLGAAARLGKGELWVSIAISLSLFAYSAFLRRFLLVPTLLTGIVATCPVWAPLVLWSQRIDRWQWVFVMSTVVLMTAREIFMDVRDKDGDHAGHRDTFATLFGPNVGKFLALVLSVTGAALIVLVVVSRIWWLGVVQMSSCLVLGITILYLVFSPMPSALSRCGHERPVMNRFVVRSRLAMGLIPFLVLSLWFE